MLRDIQDILVTHHIQFYLVTFNCNDKYRIGFETVRAQEVFEFIKQRDTKYKTKVKQSWLASDLKTLSNLCDASCPSNAFSVNVLVGDLLWFINLYMTVSMFFFHCFYFVLFILFYFYTVFYP